MIVEGGEERNGGGGEDGPPDAAAALRHDRRREIVAHLVAAGGEASLVRLASEIAEATGEPLPDVVVELHDVHVPELTGSGLVEYDEDTGAMSLARDPAAVEALLDEHDG